MAEILRQLWVGRQKIGGIGRLGNGEGEACSERDLNLRPSGNRAVIRQVLHPEGRD